MGLDLWKDELLKNITELTNRLNSIEEDNLELKQDNLELKSQVKILIQEQEECKNNYTRGIEMFISINTHVEIFIILSNLIFQNNFFNKIFGIFPTFLEVGSLLLWKFGLGCYTPLALRAAADGKHDFDSPNSRAF